MKTTGERWNLHNEHHLNAFVENIRERLAAGEKPSVALLAHSRTLDQNTMFYALYRDIANQMQDRSIVEVKRDCKLRYGVAIKKGGDPEWSQWYDDNVKPWSFEAKLMLMDDYPITSNFTKAQGSEYIDQIIADYTRQGFALARPPGA